MSRGNIVETGSDVSVFGEAENLEADEDFGVQGQIFREIFKINSISFLS